MEEKLEEKYKILAKLCLEMKGGGMMEEIRVLEKEIEVLCEREEL